MRVRVFAGICRQSNQEFKSSLGGADDYNRLRTQAVLGLEVVGLKVLLRVLAYLWVSPYTIAAISIGLILGGRFRRVEGVIEIHGWLIAHLLRRMWMPAMAMTVGHVVFGQTASALEVTRAHERVHVRQYERWGIAFVPTYLLISVYLYLRGRDGYRENPFEIEAYAVDTPKF